MEESKQLEGEAAEAPRGTVDAASAPVVQPKRSVSRALERAALRELKNRKREQYAEQDAADAEVVRRMREERLAADDAARAEAWQMNVDRELARAQGRAEWVDAREKAAELRREARGEQRKLRKESAAELEHKLAELRHEREAAEDAYRRVSWDMAVERGLARIADRSGWVEAHDKAVKARREYKRALRKLRRERMQGHVVRIKTSDERITSRAKVEDGRDEAIRQAMKQTAVAHVARRDAQRAGVTGEELEALKAREAQLRAYEEQLCAQTRQIRLEEEEARFKALSDQAKERVTEEALLREDWLVCKEIADIEMRRARAAQRARRKDERVRARQAKDAQRLERNAVVEGSKAREWELLTSSKMQLVALQDAYLEALEAERDQIHAIRAAERAAAPAIRERENAENARRRADKLAREEADDAAFRQMKKERAYERSLERDSAIASTDVAYRAMCGELDDKGVK